jgi:hypothetical protein
MKQAGRVSLESVLILLLLPLVLPLLRLPLRLLPLLVIKGHEQSSHLLPKGAQLLRPLLLLLLLLRGRCW